MPHPANRLNSIRMVRFETKSFEVTIQDQDGRPVKLGGATLIMSLGAAGGSPLVTKQTGSGIETLDADKGKAKVTLSSVDTAGLAAGQYKWDLWVVLPGDPPVRYQAVKLSDASVTNGMTTFLSIIPQQD